MQYSNFHTHTTYSDGKNSVRENIEAAIASSMSALGFSDHSYTDFDSRYCIKKDDLPRYIEEIRRLGREYSDRIEIYLGYELDGFAKLENRELYDYIIGDVHYVRTHTGLRDVDMSRDEFIDVTNTCFGGDSIAFAKEYYSVYAECIPQMRPDILGHIDLVTKFGLVDEDDRRYRSYTIEALETALAVCPVIEMNTGAISRGYRKTPYPAPFLLKEIKERGGKIILSSDSHRATDLCCAFDDCLEILRANGIGSVVAFKGGKLEEFGISARSVSSI